MTRRRYLLAMASAGLVLAAACSGGEKEASAPVDAQRVTVLVGDSVRFEPAQLTVQAGRPVLLTVRNSGNTEHELVIPALPARDVVQPERGGAGHGAPGAIIGHPKTKGEVTVRFTPTTPGTYDITCSLPGHRELGMVGTLTVT